MDTLIAQRCSQCHVSKPLHEFANKGTRRHSACKACVNYQRRHDRVSDQMCHYCAQSFAAKRIDLGMGFGFFCSPEHKWAAKQRQVQRTCAWCEQSFSVWESTVAKGIAHYCSQACRHNGEAQQQLIHFWDNVDQSDGPHACWPWIGSRNKSRGEYGRFFLAGKSYRAHRIAFILVNGPLNDGEEVLHRCDYPPCTNPYHLFKGTTLDNIRDRDAKGRQAKGDRLRHRHFAVGESNARAKLTDITAKECCALKGTMSQAEAARRFGVHQTVVSDLWNHKSWGHIHKAMG